MVSGLSLHTECHDEIGQVRVRVREGAVVCEDLAWSKAETSDRDYLVAFKAHKAELGTGERKDAPISAIRS